MKPTLLGAILWLCVLTSANAQGKIVPDWLDLWTRCRIAIENVQPPDVSGLTDLGFSVRDVPPLKVEGLLHPLMPGYSMPEQKWGRPGSRFVIVEREWSGDRTRRLCGVKLAEDAKAISPDEERNMVATFLAERDRLIAAGDHEIRDPDPIFSTSLGTGPIVLNRSGCRVISGLMIEARADYEPFFVAFNGEQDGDCGTKINVPLNGNFSFRCTYEQPSSATDYLAPRTSLHRIGQSG